MPTTLVLDALGEIRLIHPMDLIGEILDSGTNAIGVTLSDPETYGETAFDEALRAVTKATRSKSSRERISTGCTRT